MGNATSSWTSTIAAMALSEDRVTWFTNTFEAMTQNMERAILGKRNVIHLALTCLVS